MNVVLVLFMLVSSVKSQIGCPNGEYFQWPSCRTCPVITPCDDGYYNQGCSATSSGVCTPCEPCPSGYWKAGCGGASAGVCYECNSGISSNDILPCPPGTFSNAGTIDVSGCLPCPPGKYSNVFNASVCQDCPLARHQETGMQFCTECMGGYYLENSVCVACDTSVCSGGTQLMRCSGDRPGYCDSCPTSIGAEFPVRCPAGTYGSQPGLAASSACTPCQAGKYSGAGWTACLDCLPGTYQDEAGMSSCNECLPGYGRYNPNIIYCHRCPAGTYQPQRSAGSCKKCQPGTYNTHIGVTACTDCNLTTFNDRFGQTACRQCWAGSVAPFTGYSTCYLCPPGFRGIEGNLIICEICDFDEYQDEFMQMTCKKCPPLRTSRQNTTTIDGCVCRAGYYEVKGECEPCPENFACPVAFE